LDRHTSWAHNSKSKTMAFGQNIQAGLMQTDASGIERAGQAYAGGMSAFGQGIGNALETTADYFKQQNERKKVIKQAELYGNAAKTLFPEIATSIDESLLMIKNEDIPLSERFAAAEAIQGTLNMGMQRMKYDSEEMNAMREARLRQGQLMAQMDAERRKPLPTETFYEGGGEQKRVWNPQTQTFDLPEQFIGGGGNVPNLPADQQALFDSTMPAPMGDTDAALIAQSLQYDKANDIYTIDQGGERVPVDEAQAVQILQAAEMGQQGGISDAMVLPDKPQPLGFKPTEQKERWKPSTQNGLRGQVNEATGEFKPDPGQTGAEAANYTDPYQMEVDGKQVWVMKNKATNEVVPFKAAPQEYQFDRMLKAMKQAQEALKRGDKDEAAAIYQAASTMSPFGMGTTTPENVEMFAPLDQGQPQQDAELPARLPNESMEAYLQRIGQ
jgi:hypothetical protein